PDASRPKTTTSFSHAPVPRRDHDTGKEHLVTNAVSHAGAGGNAAGDQVPASVRPGLGAQVAAAETEADGYSARRSGLSLSAHVPPAEAHVRRACRILTSLRYEQVASLIRVVAARHDPATAGYPRSGAPGGEDGDCRRPGLGGGP